MNLKGYTKFYIKDEDHWYISKVKQISEDSINEMANALNIFLNLLKPNPNTSILKEYRLFTPVETQLSIFNEDDKTKQVKVSKYSKLFLSLKLLSEGLVAQTQVSFKNPKKYHAFQTIIEEFKKGKSYKYLTKKYTEHFLNSELEIYYRNFESWLSKFGFMGRINDSEYCFFTDVGLEFVKSRNDIELSCAIFLNQIKKLQVWNPTMDKKYSDIKVIPYYVILELLLKIDNNKFDKSEYVLFITKLKTHNSVDIEMVVSLIHQFRELTKEKKSAYIEYLKKLDKKRYPKRNRTNFERLYDSSTKEISAYTFGGITNYDDRDHFYKLINKEQAIKELKHFRKSLKFIDFKKKSDWIRHLGSLNGLSTEDILELYVNEGKSLQEILNTLDIDDLKLEQTIKDKLLEKEIEEYYEKNLKEINPDLQIVKVPYGRQYATPIGPIDILCQHKKTKEYFVLEFKRSQVSDDTIGQILRYMGWVYLSMERSKKTVNGIIIGYEFPDKIHYTLQGIQSPHIFRILSLHRHEFTEKNRPILNKA